MKKLLSVLVFVVLLTTVVLISGCSPSSFTPVASGAIQPPSGVIKYVGEVLAQEFVEKNGETHTILFLNPRVDEDTETKYQSLTIEVTNRIIFTVRGTWSDFWLFEFTPTNQPNIYTITKMSY